jgi:hypothetical protein
MFRTVPLSFIRSLLTVHSAMVYAVQVCRQLSSRTRMELQFHPGPARKLSTKFVKLVRLVDFIIKKFCRSVTSCVYILICYYYLYCYCWSLGWRSGYDDALLVGRSRDRFPVVSLDFSLTYSFRLYHGPGVDSVPCENEYQENLLGVKAAGAWGWQPHHLHVPNVMEIWEPKPPGTLWATPSLLRESFTFTSITIVITVYSNT